MAKYKMIYRKQDLGRRISTLYRQEKLAVGILDFGSEDELKRSVSWFLRNMNLSIHVLTTEYRLDGYVWKDEVPDVSFIAFRNDASTGEYVNAMAAECYAECFLIVRSDMETVAFDAASLLSLMSGKRHPVALSPILVSSLLEIMPTLRSPHLEGKRVVPTEDAPSPDSPVPFNTLYPVLAVGLYNRALFQRLRGYDEKIEGEYYQTLDLGVRSWLYGDSILCSPLLAFSFPDRSSVGEDKSDKEGMNRFYTKALSIRNSGGKNVVSKWKPFVDKKVYSDEVKKRQAALQKVDFFALTENWKKEG